MMSDSDDPICRVCFESIQNEPQYCECKGSVSIHKSCIENQMKSTNVNYKSGECDVCSSNFHVKFVQSQIKIKDEILSKKIQVLTNVLYIFMVIGFISMSIVGWQIYNIKKKKINKINDNVILLIFSILFTVCFICSIMFVWFRSLIKRTLCDTIEYKIINNLVYNPPNNTIIINCTTDETPLINVI
jgi:hypothetical protein